VSARLVMTTVDGRLIVAVPVSNRLYRVTVDGSPMPRPMTRGDLRTLISGRDPRLLRAAERDHEGFYGPIPAAPQSIRNSLSGSCGIVMDHPTRSDLVVKVVALPDAPLSQLRRWENKNRLDPWRAYVGSSILAINRWQADLFRYLSQNGSPSALPRVDSYREGLLDRDSLDQLCDHDPEMCELLTVGTPVASWVMERIPNDDPDPVARNTSRRQVLDYLFQEHGMLARDLGSDDNWGARFDGSAVVLDPVVIPVRWMNLGNVMTLNGIRNGMRRVRDANLDQYLGTVIPFGSIILDGEESVAVAILATNLAYRNPDPAFDGILMDYLKGRVLPYSQRSYLGYAHGMKPFNP